MDESAFRQKVSGMTGRNCAFEKAVLTRCVSCSRSDRIQFGERETATCLDETSHSRCTELHELLRRSFSFALKILPEGAALTHAQEMRIQCGGLRGLHKVLSDDCAVDDVDGLLMTCLQKWGKLADIPYSEVVHAAAGCYKGRREQS